MQNETVNETEANKECDKLSQVEQLAAEYTLSDEQIQMQKVAMH